MKMTIADHFTLPKILRFALPSMVMMVFTSLYTIVDGLAVSNLVGDQAFSSLNLIWPAVGMLGAFGFMIGSGGNALISSAGRHCGCGRYPGLSGTDQPPSGCDR